jgi:hypothetical protein
LGGLGASTCEGGVERKVGFSVSAASDRVAGSMRSGNATKANGTNERRMVSIDSS